MSLTVDSPFNDVAQAIILETIRRGYTRAKSVAVVSTGIQESGLRMVWDPSHQWYGYYQQDGGYPNRMDPMGNITGFLDRLDVKFASPGASDDPYKDIFWLQQRPSEATADNAYMHGRMAYYDEISSHDAQAQALYDQFAETTPVVAPAAPADPNKPDFNEYAVPCENNQDRGGTPIDLFLLHTEESSGTDNADGLAHYLISTTGGENPVSYNFTISQAADGGVTVCVVVPSSLAAWAVGNSNNRSINLCFAGSRAAWTRDDWMLQSKAINVAAYIAVRECKANGIPLRVIVPYSDPGGVADHRYCTDFLKDGNTHTDVGGPLTPPWTNFPWDVFIADFNAYATGTIEESDDMSATAEQQIADLHLALMSKKTSRSIYKTPGEGDVWPWYELPQNDDAMIHMLWIDALAQDGIEWAVQVVATAAAGKGDDKDAWVAQHATNVLKRVPQDVLAQVLNS
jgi:hypothetical protein